MEGTLEEPPIKDSSQASPDKHLKGMLYLIFQTFIAIFLRTTNIHFSVCFISSVVQKLTSVSSLYFGFSAGYYFIVFCNTALNLDVIKKM